MEEKEAVHSELETLACSLINGISGEGVVREGTVMTIGPAPYRRLDCDGRALAYVRTRPRKRAVRVDVSSLWTPARVPKSKIPSATGSTCLLLRSTEDVDEAIAFLRETVDKTRGLKERRVSGLRF